MHFKPSWVKHTASSFWSRAVMPWCWNPRTKYGLRFSFQRLSEHSQEKRFFISLNTADKNRRDAKIRGQNPASDSHFNVYQNIVKRIGFSISLNTVDKNRRDAEIRGQNTASDSHFNDYQNIVKRSGSRVQLSSIFYGIWKFHPLVHCYIAAEKRPGIFNPVKKLF